MRKEFLQLKRDRLTFAMIVGVPVMQMLLFGYAINTDVRNLASAVANQSNSHLSGQFVADLGETQVLDLQYVVETPQEIEALLQAGRISIGVYIPPDFDRRVIDDRRTAAHLMVDATDPTVLGVANQLRDMPLKFDTTMLPPERAAAFEVRPYFNPERRSVVFVIPGLIGIILTLTMMLFGIILTLTMMLFTAVSVVREREHGNLELLINTPVSTTQLMVGKIVPYILIGIVQLALVITVGRYLFKVPIHGSILDLLYLAASVFVAANLALGLFVSTVVKTQFQAMQATVFVLLPSILLSGFMFPFDGMPRIVQAIHRRGFANDPFRAPDARHHVAKRAARRHVTGAACPGHICAAGDDRGDDPLFQTPRLMRARLRMARGHDYGDEHG
jgi:ABC-2 type transport system permease protein